MLKKSLLFLTGTALLLASCSTGSSPGNSAPSSSQKEEGSSLVSSSSSPSSESPLAEEGVNLERYVENQYPELLLTVSFQNKMAILPGMTVPIRVIIQNTGDKTVQFTMGSGVNVVPDALRLVAPGLQVTPLKEELGPATNDLQRKILAPGEHQEYLVFLTTVEPSSTFVTKAIDLLRSENLYVGDLDLKELEERFPESPPAKPGSYQAEVYFLYNLPEEKVDPAKFPDYVPGNPTGYQKATLPFTIGE